MQTSSSIRCVQSTGESAITTSNYPTDSAHAEHHSSAFHSPGIGACYRSQASSPSQVFGRRVAPYTHRYAQQALFAASTIQRIVSRTHVANSLSLSSSHCPLDGDVHATNHFSSKSRIVFIKDSYRPLEGEIGICAFAS